jgi:[NiFe] hydrogenase assembly HybE family chaperone
MDDDAARAIGEQLAARYREIDDGPMRDMPVCNPALRVEAVGFRAHDGAAVGIIVTPWFMNLVVADGRASPQGQSSVVALPAGDVACVGGNLEGFGPLRACSLFSPMFEFADADAARQVATETIALLFAPPAPEEGASEAPGLDRRALLRGRLATPEARP